MKLVLSFLKPHWKLCTLTVFLIFIDVVGALIIPTFAAELMNEAQRGMEFNTLIITADLTRKGLRKNFGMVLQDTWLFGGTIAENIAYGRPDATREEIIKAAKMAKVDYFIRTMPQGYDTVLENDAGNLSVGQRQLLTIARVFLCDPPVLILDEATSSVDTRTEVEIGKAMKELRAAERVSSSRTGCLPYATPTSFCIWPTATLPNRARTNSFLKRAGAYAALYNSQFA